MAMELFKIFGRIALNGVDVVNNQLGETTNNAGKSSNKMVSAFKKIGTAVATYFAFDKIKEFGKACVAAAADVAAENAAFEQIMGDYAEEAQAKLDKVAKATGITSSRMTGYMTSLSAKFKGLGYNVDDATSLAARGMNLVADGAAFWDMSLDETTSHLNSFINGSYEGGEAIGLFANDTQMALYAVEQGVIDDTKAWSSLDEATKQATRLEYAENMYAMSGATGQAAKESDAYLNVQGELSEAWRQFKATIGEPILENFVIPAMQKLATEVIPFLQEKVIGIIDWIKEAYNWYKENEVVINAVAIAVGVLVAGLGMLQLIETVKTWIMGMKTAMLALNVTMAANPIAIVVLALAALGAAFAYLWNNCEEFRNFWIGLWNDISSWCKQAGEDISNWFKGAWEDVSAWFMNAWEDISNWFTNAWNGVSSWFEGAWNDVSEWFKGAWDTISNWFKGAWNSIAEWFSGAVTDVTEWFKGAWEDVSNWFEELWNGISSFFSGTWNTISETVTSATNSIDETVTNIFNSISEFVTGVWDSITNTISDKITSAKQTVDETVNTIKSTVSDVFDGIKAKATEVWDGVKSAINEPIEEARDFVKGCIDSIKGFFNVTLGFNGIKLPRIEVAWNTHGIFGDVANFLGLQGIPYLTVAWNKLGAIFDKPTIFSTPYGLQGVGEAGPEAVAPIDTLMGYVSAAVKKETDDLNYNIQKLTSMLSDYMPQIVNGMDRPLVLDTGAIVGGIARNMDGKLGDINRMKGRGN